VQSLEEESKDIHPFFFDIGFKCDASDSPNRRDSSSSLDGMEA
jgi:hypothetical protein